MRRVRDHIRILLLGEPQVGKTTLILSLVSEEFSSKVPAQAEEITIPADVTPERVPTQIVDYSTRVQSEAQLRSELGRADVICLVHALNDDASLERLSSFWLPLVRQRFASSDIHVPIILVGNKLDLVNESKLSQVLPLMSEFPEIETSIECSAKTLLNLSETFWFAQKAVLYPTAPLYDVELKELTASCVRALTRVFRICDTDNDGYLSDRELEAFQSRCFSVPLTTQSMLDVKQLVRQSCPGGVTLNGITQKGFLFLHLLFVQKGRHETTWTVLRQFGYDNQIRLSNEFLYPNFVIPPGCSTELSSLGTQFLLMLFNKYDLDRDGCLSPTELSELLATCPTDQSSTLSNLSLVVTTNSSGWITLQGFVAYWIMLAYRDPSRLLEYFAYLGFTYFAAGSFWSTITPPHTHPSHQTTLNAYVVRETNDANHRPSPSSPSATNIRRSPSGRSSTNVVARSESGLEASRSAQDALLRALIVTGEKRLDIIRKSTQRTVFYCRVYGASKVGKTCLLQGLLGRHLRGHGGLAIGGLSGRASNWVAACGIPIFNEPRTLLMHEVNSQAGLLMSASEALSADVACLVYDVSDANSFAYVAELYRTYYRGTRVPCLFVSSKSDQPSVVQNYDFDPFDLCTKFNLSPPEPFSTLNLAQQIDCSRLQVPFNACSEDSIAAGGDQSTHRPADHRTTRRAGSVEPHTSHAPSDASGLRMASAADLPNLGLSGMSRNLTGDHNEDYEKGGFPHHQTRSRRYSRPDSTSTVGRLPHVLVDEANFAPVYIKLCVLANYPHLRGLEVATADHAWKWTLAATILAGFGFVAFRIAKTHF